jgi:DNA-binding PucR family transcriptional regulator
VNRRSLYHRLDRISKLLGRDLESPEAATRLTVALRGLAIIQRGEGP